MVLRSFGVVLAVVMMALVCAPAMAVDASTGFVDVQKVFADYEKTKTSNSSLETYGKQLDAQLTALQQHKLLDDNERKQLLDLINKPTPTDKDKEAIKALDDRQKALEQELQTLQGKNPPSDAEKARQKELQDRSAKTDEDIAKTNDEFEKQFNSKKEELSKSIRDDILKAIEDVSKEKKMTFVVDKIAVLFGGTDITQSVLDKLNKK